MARPSPATSEDQGLVFRHRLKRFLDMGFMPADAELLAMVEEVECQLVEDMLDAGCQHQLALEIVI